MDEYSCTFWMEDTCKICTLCCTLLWVLSILFFAVFITASYCFLFWFFFWLKGLWHEIRAYLSMPSESFYNYFSGVSIDSLVFIHGCVLSHVLVCRPLYADVDVVTSRMELRHFLECDYLLGKWGMPSPTHFL